MKFIIISIALFIIITLVLICLFCAVVSGGIDVETKDDEQIEYIKKWKEENQNNGDHQY